MPSLPIRCVCSECDARLSINDSKLIGKMIECPKCGEEFVVEPLDDEETPHKRTRDREYDEVDEVPRKSARRRKEGDDDDKSRTRQKPARNNDYDRPVRKLKSRKRKKGPGLTPWLVAGGGIVLAAGIALIVYLLVRDNGKSDKNGNDESARTTNDSSKQSARTTNDSSKQAANPIGGLNPGSGPFVNIEGSWPEPQAPFNFDPRTTVTFHVLIVADSQPEANGLLDAIGVKIGVIIPNIGKGVGAAGSSRKEPGSTNLRWTLRLGPVAQDANSIAKQIDFGKVYGVKDNVITMLVKTGDLPIPEPKK